jgi:hypothetical protein
MTYQQLVAQALISLGEDDDAGAMAWLDDAVAEANRIDPEGPRVAEVLTYVAQVHRLAGRKAEAWAALERLKAIHARFPQLSDPL